MKQIPPLLIIRLRNESCLYGRKTGGAEGVLTSLYTCSQGSNQLGEF